MFNQNRLYDAINNRYVCEEYIRHNHHLEEGKEFFIKYFKRMTK